MVCPQWRVHSGVKLFASNILTYLVHDYLIAHSHDQTVVIKVRESCCSGTFSWSPLKVLDASAAGVLTITKKVFRDLFTEEFENMKLMYNQFIPPERHPDYFPLSFHQWCSTQQVAGHHLVLQVLAPLHFLRQCDHVNKVHAQLLAVMGLVIRTLNAGIGGHTTTAGCPLVQ